MPTANPIMVMMFSTRKFNSQTCPISADTPTATTIDAIASTSGMPAATAAPNTMSRMISATGMPIISPRSAFSADSSFASRLMLPVPAVSARKPSVPDRSSSTDSSPST